MKTALITGASSGIGYESAKCFANDGYRVIFCYQRNAAGATQLVHEIASTGGVAVAYQVDVMQREAVQELIATIQKEYGRIDVLVNNAGGYTDGDEWDGEEVVWQETLERNLMSVMRVSKACIPIFQSQQCGVMVNVASRLGVNGHYEELAYGAAKAGVINLTQAYAKLLSPFGRANVVSPGVVRAGYWLTAPAEEREAVVSKQLCQKLIEPAAVAEMILYLGTDRSEGVSGQNYLVG